MRRDDVLDPAVLRADLRDMRGEVRRTRRVVLFILAVELAVGLAHVARSAYEQFGF